MRMSPRFHPFVRLVLCAFAVLIAQVAAGLMLAVPNQVTLALPGGAVTARGALLLLFAATPGTLLAVALCRRWMDGQTLASLGLRWRGAVPDFVRGTLCGALAVAFVFGVLWLVGGLEVRGLSQRAQEVGSGGIAARLMVWAAAMLCVGFTEELLFRGYALHNLGVWLGVDKIGLGAAAIMQALVFALVHLANFGASPSPEQAASAWQAMPNIVLIGLFFAFCAFKTGALWFPIGFHAAWNFFLGSVFSLPVSGLQFFKLLDVRVSASHWLTGGSFGIEGSLLLTALTATMIYLMRRSDDHPQALADIESLIPASEVEDDVEVGSRAPRLRERKEKRAAQIPQKVTFEGWNDLKPETREPYSVYKPPIPAPNAASAEAPETTLAASEEESFSEFRPASDAPPSPAAPETAPAAPLPTVPPPVANTPAPVAPTSPPQEPPVKKTPGPRW